MDPRQEYEARLSVRRTRVTAAEKRDELLSNVRVAVFATFAALGVLYWGMGYGVGPLLVVPAAVFVALVVVHDRVAKGLQDSRQAVAYYERNLRRLDGEWHGEGVVDTDFEDPDHPYARDLDLFGVGSLFDLMCVARTRFGQFRLAAWLSEGAPLHILRLRQEAAEELAPRVELREDLALLASGLAGEVHPEALEHFGNRPPVLRPGQRRMWSALAWVAVVATVAASVAWALGFGPVPLIGVAVVVGLVGRTMTPKVEEILAGLNRPERELRLVLEVVARLEGESAQSAGLRIALDGFRSGETVASKAIRSLLTRVVWLDATRNQFFYPIGFLTLWRVHFAIAIERWRIAHGAHVRTWLSSLGEFEALTSLAGYAFERPQDSWPTIVEGGPVFRGTQLGHPLLPATSMVRNDVSLSKEAPALLVSGSNMSGKSTLLRTVGLNTVLARAGAPICGASLELSELNVGASIQTHDSLVGGKSRFYAEIIRLKQVLDLAHGDGDTLFLLDEILHGTNSHDRQIGGRALIASFIEAGAIGLVTTHDLALARHDDPRIRNVHFVDEMVEGELVFDYELRDGVVQRSNAIDLMRSIGLAV